MGEFCERGLAAFRQGARAEHLRRGGVGSWGANAKSRPATRLMARLGRRKALGMSTKVQDYLEGARYCEDMAAMTGGHKAGHKVSADFAELARQWRELARQRQDFEKSLPDSE
jgi:hypothetical protein